ncbi:MAG: M36 family metallopeptidase, partial [Actinobacteria bacterium]|nr:M36 family metallopeptidase [Actinomycetota bacterium]
MGESYSDLTAVEYLMEYGYVPTDSENPFSVGAYVTGNKESGIRNYGMNRSPLNYSGVQGYDGSGSPHDDGEIWSA